MNVAGPKGLVEDARSRVIATPSAPYGKVPFRPLSPCQVTFEGDLISDIPAGRGPAGGLCQNEHMPARKSTPSKVELEHYLEQGLTHEQIVNEHYKKTGERVARSSVSVAISRYGLSDERHRHTETIPWKLTGKDLRAYPIRMLRLLGRRRAGERLTADEDRRLDSWLAILDRENAVVAWDPDSSPSIFYTDREPTDDPAIPIRRQRVWLRPQYRPGS